MTRRPASWDLSKNSYRYSGSQLGEIHHEGITWTLFIFSSNVSLTVMNAEWHIASTNPSYNLQSQPWIRFNIFNSLQLLARSIWLKFPAKKWGNLGQLSSVQYLQQVNSWSAPGPTLDLCQATHVVNQRTNLLRKQQNIFSIILVESINQSKQAIRGHYLGSWENPVLARSLDPSHLFFVSLGPLGWRGVPGRTILLCQERSSPKTGSLCISWKFGKIETPRTNIL